MLCSQPIHSTLTLVRLDSKCRGRFHIFFLCRLCVVDPREWSLRRTRSRRSDPPWAPGSRRAGKLSTYGLTTCTGMTYVPVFCSGGLAAGGLPTGSYTRGGFGGDDPSPGLVTGLERFIVSCRASAASSSAGSGCPTFCAAKRSSVAMSSGRGPAVLLALRLLILEGGVEKLAMAVDGGFTTRCGPPLSSRTSPRTTCVANALPR